MKNNYCKISCLWQMHVLIGITAFLLSTGTSHAQTALAAGDIAFTGVNTNNSSTLANEFSFVILRTGGIASGTTINFTDNGWNSSLATPALGTSEGVVTWNATSALPQFTEIFIKVNTTGNGITTISSGSATVTGSFILSQGGDQILAYQGTASSPVFIAGIHFNANSGDSDSNPSTLSGWDDLTGGTSPYPFTSNSSAIPPGLTNGTNAVMVVDGAAPPFTEYDNVKYNCTGSTGPSLSDIRNAVNDRNNWLKQNLTAYTLPTGCAFGIVSSPVITTEPSNSTVCAGNNAQFSVTASNATGYQWQVNTGAGFVNLANVAPYSGVTTSLLTITNVPAGFNGNLYRVIVSGTVAPNDTSISALLTVNQPPHFPADPSDVLICEGISLSAVVPANNATAYQWQVNTGSGFVNLTNSPPYSGVTTSTLTITSVSTGLSGNQYRVIASGLCPPPDTSNAFTLTVPSAPVITSESTGDTVCAGGNTSFMVSATNASAYQWQVNSGSGFVNLTNGAPYSGVTTPTLSITGATAGLNGNQYRVVVSGPCTPEDTSNAMVLIVPPAPVITMEPTGDTVCAGANVNFGVTANNVTAYQWQVNTGTGFVNLTNSPPYSGVTTSTLTITGATTGLSGNQYRAIASGVCPPPDTSNAALLIVQPAPVITSEPAGDTICAGNTASFTVTAANAMSYQWQLNSGSGFVNLSNSAPYSGVTTPVLTITGATATLNGNLYRVIVTGSCSPADTSATAALTIFNAPAIVQNPLGDTICAGLNTSFTVSATDALSYQWQVNTGSGYTNLNNTAPYSGVTGPTLTITGAPASLNGNLYRVVVTGACSPVALSTGAPLSVLSAPAIVSQPSSVTVSPGGNTGFSVTASNALSYQWQVNQGSGFMNLSNTGPYSGVTTPSLTITGATASLNGFAYRVVVSGVCAPNAISDTAYLNVMAEGTFTLVNATTDTDISQITNGAVINTTGAYAINIRYNPVVDAHSVWFKLNNAGVRVENTAPFSLAGDNNGDYQPWIKPEGTYLLTAISYPSANRGGTPLDTTEVTFYLNLPPAVNAGPDQSMVYPLSSSVTLSGTASDPAGIQSVLWTQQSGPVSAVIDHPNSLSTTVHGLTAAGTYIFRLTATDIYGVSSSDEVRVVVTNAVQPYVASFTLINADTDTDIGTIANNAVIDLSTLPTQNLNIRVNTVPAVTGSVAMVFDNIMRTENQAPYSVFGDNNGNYIAHQFTVGTHTLQATAYTGANATGSAGTPLLIHFTVVNGGSLARATMNAPLAIVSESVYPNPSTDLVHISFVMQEASDVKVSIYDEQGVSPVQVYTRQASEGEEVCFDWDCSGLRSGFYIVKIQAGNQILVKKIEKR